ncbi:hypothetical protein STEG23_005011 [Scotinomys teguina]
MQPGRTTNTGGGTMEVKAAAPRCQLLLILLMSAVMLLPGTNVHCCLFREQSPGPSCYKKPSAKDSEKPSTQQQGWIYVRINCRPILDSCYKLQVVGFVQRHKLSSLVPSGMNRYDVNFSFGLHIECDNITLNDYKQKFPYKTSLPLFRESNFSQNEDILSQQWRSVGQQKLPEEDALQHHFTKC